MADFRLGRLKFNWRGDWTGNTAYVIDDIVKFGANAYVCVTNHTSTDQEKLIGIILIFHIGPYTLKVLHRKEIFKIMFSIE